MTAFALPAFAQTAPPANGSAPAASNLSVYPQCQTVPTKGESEKAHQAYLLGKSSFDEGDYSTAINYFKDAYRRDCTKHELLNIIARAYELKGDLPEAINALDVYIHRLGPNDPQVDGLQKRMGVLREKLAQQPQPPASGTSTGTTPPNGTGAATANPSAAATGTTAPPPATGPVREHTVLPWIVVGTGAVGIAVGVAVAVVGVLNRKSAEDECPNNVCPSGVDPNAQMKKVDDANSVATIGGVVAGVGGALVIGGLVWHFLEPTGPEPAANAKLRVRPMPVVAPGYAGLAAGGTF